MDLADVEREALHDWLANRPDPEPPPDPGEYRDLEPPEISERGRGRRGGSRGGP